MTLLLGIDPGLQHTGWGVVESHQNRLTYIACGTLHSNASQPLEQRLLALHDGLQNVIARYQPCEAAMEETFVNKNAMTSLKLGQARGALLLTVSLAGLPVSEYAATVIKKSVVGAGRADKGQVEQMIRYILPGASVESADAADALAVAVCHANHRSTIQAMEK